MTATSAHRSLRLMFALILVCSLFASAAQVPEAARETGDVALPAVAARPLKAFFSIDVASAYFFDSGYVLNDVPVVQPYLGVSDGREFLPLKFSIWGNFATRRDEFMTVDRGFTEIDIGIGSEHTFKGGLYISADLKTSQFPNQEGWKAIEFFTAKTQRRFGPVLLGGRMKYLMSGGYANDVQLIPFGELSAPQFHGVKASIHAQACYNLNKGSKADAWTACTLTAKLGWRNVYGYVKRTIQMSDTLYTDAQHAVESTIYGCGWFYSW